MNEMRWGYVEKWMTLILTAGAVVVTGCQTSSTPDQFDGSSGRHAPAFGLRFELMSRPLRHCRIGQAPAGEDAKAWRVYISGAGGRIGCEEYLLDAWLYAGDGKRDYGGLRVLETPTPACTSAGPSLATDDAGPQYVEVDTISTSGPVRVEAPPGDGAYPPFPFGDDACGIRFRRKPNRVVLPRPRPLLRRPRLPWP